MTQKVNIGVLYLSVEELDIILKEHRLHLVVDFIHETAKDVLDDIGVLKRINEYDFLMCKYFSNPSFQKRISLRIKGTEFTQLLAMYLYGLFLVCRKMTIEDKKIVMENFEQTRMY